MCGIAGIRRFDGEPVSRDVLMQMASALRHRGPDAMDFWHEGSVGMAHTRLSIIDLERSQQPMSNPDGSQHLVFNGEILNYKQLRRECSYPYRTRGDTEVVLAVHNKYGPTGAEHLRGQFAFAIHDSNIGNTYLLRDRLGIIPIYYYADEQIFAFASEVKALFPVMRSRAIDEDSLHDYLAHRAVPAPYSMIKGVRKLPPGHRLTLTADGTFKVSAYWQLASQPAVRKVTATEAVDLVDTALSASVRESLVADVPVGVYLSGGVDSSLLTAMTRREMPDGVLHTFGASFGDERYDETPWARKVAKLWNTTHHEVLVTTDNFLQSWAELSWHRDGPLSEPADVAIFMLAERARQQVKVVLSGEGSDELFAGYPKHRYASATRWLGAVAAMGPAGILEKSLPANRPKLRIAARALTEASYEERLRGWFSPFTAAERHQLTGRRPPRNPPAAYRGARGDSLHRMLYADSLVWLTDNLLERGDRMSMAASLETRPPFLDYRLVELAFSLPSNVKIRNRTTKWVLKEVARRYLPAEIVDRPKIGFKVPLDRWFRLHFKEMAFDLLTGPTSYVGNNFNRAFVAKLLDNHFQSRSDEESRIWTLLSLEMWQREMVSRKILQPRVDSTASL